MADKAHFELFEDSEGEHRYRLRAANGKIVCQSEGYRDVYAAERGAVDLVNTAMAAARRMPERPLAFNDLRAR